MSRDQYWTGEGIDLDALWTDFDAGRAFESKVASLPMHVLRLTFKDHPPHLPLFDHEIVYKTVKGTFHEVKAACFTQAEYSATAPIFIHRIARGSGIFDFLGQLDPVLTWTVALGGASMWYRKALVWDQNFDQQQLEFLRREFPGASVSDQQAYLRAWTTFGRRRVMHRLLEQGLSRVEVSRHPLTPANEEVTELVDMRRIIEDAGNDENPP